MHALDRDDALGVGHLLDHVLRQLHHLRPARLAALDVLVDRLLVAALVLQRDVDLVWLALYSSVSVSAPPRASTLRPCQNVISTGRVTPSSASTGHGGSDASGVVVVVAIAVARWPSSAAASRRAPPSLVGRRRSSWWSPRAVAPRCRPAGSTSPDPQPPARVQHGERRAPRRARLHPLTPPDVRPRTSWRWKTSSTMTIGTAAMIDAGHHEVRLVEARWLQRRSPLCSVYMSVSVVIRFGHRYWFHVDRNASSGERADRRAHQRHGDVAQEPEVADAVDRRRVAQVARQRQEHLADQERAERGGEERHGEALVRVEPAERVDGAPVDDERRLHRHEQRGEEGGEQHVAAGELEDREGVRRQHRRHDLGDRDDRRRRRSS